jgi:group II intron reverse transcriptase/maturase
MTAPTLLHQTLLFPNLRRAWNEVADNDGIPGVDAISIRRWRRNWEERLINLAAAVRGNRYKPGKLRRKRISKNRGPGYRTLRIPTVTDRVLQRAVLQILYPIFEPRFLDCSFGYRPGRSLQDAVRRINSLRRDGFFHVLDADIDDFFNQVDHALLRQFLSQDLPDETLLPLIDLWLHAGRSQPDQPRGIPMGSPLSPILANILLHRLDQRITTARFPIVRYADDFIVLAGSQSDLHDAHTLTAGVLASLKLRFEPFKTRLTTFEQGFEFIGVFFEDGWYWYTWQDKKIEVHDDQPQPILDAYWPQY